MASPSLSFTSYFVTQSNWGVKEYFFGGYAEGMCRSIKTLRGDATVTEVEVQAAALQFVRKVSGYRVPSRANAEVFDAAVAEIAVASQRLLDSLAEPGARAAGG
jgi:hypothetical protein